MLELKSYSMSEIIDIFGINNPQNLERTLRGYQIEFTKTGKGQNANYNITTINDELRLFCILDLGFDSRTDMRKLTNFLYLLLNNDEFVNMPEVYKETMLMDENRYVSRQTIARYTEKLKEANLIADGDFIYYFIKNNRRKKTSRKKYNKAWREYFEDKANGASSSEAILKMLLNYGGYARKYAPPEQNAIERDIINYLNDLVLERIQKEYEPE